MRLEACVLGGALLLLLGACDISEPPLKTVAAPVELTTGIAAAYSSGEIRLEKVEAEFATARTPDCVQAKSSPASGSVKALIPCYREIAEALAIEEIVLADIPDREQALNALDDNYLEQRNAALLNVYSRQLAEQVVVTDAETEQFFTENKDDFRTPRRFTLYNIFRRHRDPGKQDETTAFLLKLKSRIDAGETFGSIARKHSDSETRLRDGLVGGISDQQLPQRLRDVTDRLDSGQVSEPIMVNGGAVLIKIEGATPATQPDLERHRSLIIRRLTEQKTQAAIDAHIADREIPADAIVFSAEELLEQLDSDDPYQLVFDLGGQQLTIAEFRNMTGLQPADVAADLPAEGRDLLIESYRQLQRRRLLLIDLLASNEEADRILRKQVEQPLNKERLTRLVDEQLQQDMWQYVDQNSAALERFFKDNNHHYQTPLKFRLQAWHLPFDTDPVAQMAAMEFKRTEMEQGDYALPSAVESLGGSIEDLGWRELAELTDLPKKAQSYLLQAATGGYSIPYQQDETLHMLWVEDRQVPVALDYESVRERVREDYYARFERRLYLDAVENRLTTAHFVFSDENVRRWLLPPGTSDR